MNHLKLETAAFVTAFVVLICTMFAAFAQRADANKYGEEQLYVVRYGIVVQTADTNDDGITTIQTQDGNKWQMQDVGELVLGDRVRLLFDSKRTHAAEDDVIIDFTELED